MKTAPREVEGKPLSVDEALARILERIHPLPDEERPILDALGAVLAEDVRAANDVPPFANSAMDGYAVRASDVAGASPQREVRLPVRLDIAAGDAAERPLAAGAAARIMTGAPLPRGADTVVRFEDTDRGEAIVGIRVAVPRGENVRRAGEDLRAGEVVLTRGAIFHEVQFAVLTRLRADGLLPVTPANRDAARDAVDAAATEIIAHWEDKLWPAIDRVWNDGVDGIRADLREWLRRAADDAGGFAELLDELLDGGARGFGARGLAAFDGD